MPDYINTEIKTVQYDGPVSSANYNLRAEQNYNDLVHLYNRSGVLDQKLNEAFERVLKDHLSISMAVSDLEDRVKAIEYTSNSFYKQLSIYSYSQIDIGSFSGNSEFAFNSTEVLSFDHVYNTVSLPKVDGSSYSKLKFFNTTSKQVIPDFLETKIENNFVSADTPGVLIDTTPISYAFLDKPDKFWKRNVIVDNPSPAGAQMYFYVKIPNIYSGSDSCNFISLVPYPLFSVDILSIEYTSSQKPTLSSADNWIPLNSSRLYNNETEAIGRVAPGAWSTVGSDAILNCGPIGFYFSPINITAIRINMRQRSYFSENGKTVYTYGLSDLEVKSQKFLDTGRTIFKFEAPNDTLIFNVEEVIPKIYNIPVELISTAFSYRIIYKNSGIYTLINPGSSTAIWIEVTLNQLHDGTAPVLSDLIVNYT